jgi:TPR repeat protein
MSPFSGSLFRLGADNGNAGIRSFRRRKFAVPSRFLHGAQALTRLRPASPQQSVVLRLSRGVFAMFFQMSPMVLSCLLTLGFTGFPSTASTAQLGNAAPGTDLFQRGWKYDQGLGTPINLPEAFRLYQGAATQGNPLAKGRMARFYFSGNGVQRDEGQAARLSREAFPGVLRAAERNDAVAQMIVGTMYVDGLGVPRDATEGLRWLHKAADQNLPLAKADLGVMYENGQGVPMDITEAVKWYREAAAQNSAMAQACLGDLYDQGRGVPRDEVEAARLYRLSADQNFAHSQTNLGYMYEHGCVVEWNPCEAVRLYRLAAEQNFAVAQANLGTMYEKGCGVRRDLNEAANWYQRAAAQGDAHAIEALRCLASPAYYYCRPRATCWCR